MAGMAAGGEPQRGGPRRTWDGAAQPEYTAPSSPRRSSTPPGVTLSTTVLVISVVVTLLVYWLAEV